MFAGLHHATFPCGMTNHGARSGCHIRHHGRWFSARFKHGRTYRRANFIFSDTSFRRIDTRLHSRFGSSCGILHYSNLYRRLADPSLFNNAKTIQQFTIGQCVVNAILMIRREEVAVALIADTFFIKTKFTQGINQHLNRITGIRIRTGDFHPGAGRDVRLFQFPGDHKRLIFEWHDQGLKEGITRRLIIRQIHNVFWIGNYHRVHVALGYPLTQFAQSSLIFLKRKGHIIAFSHAGSCIMTLSVALMRIFRPSSKSALGVVNGGINFTTRPPVPQLAIIRPDSKH